MATDVAERVVPEDVEDRVQGAVDAYRDTHRHPANIGLHAVGYVLILRGLWAVVRGHMGSGLVQVALGVGSILTGHRIEGSTPFAAAKALRSPQ